MNTVRVHLKERSHNIVIGRGLLRSLGENLCKLDIGKDAFIITNALIKNKYGKLVNRSLKKVGFSIKYKVIPDTERSKSIDEAFSIIKDLSKYDKKKKIFIIALGGGVVGDVSGFVASVYKRGIPYVQVPTTLLAQIDSSIGGKTAIDLASGKNLVGAFYQPRLILSDVSTLRSLDTRQIRSGLAEAIKYGVIKDKFLFAYLEKNYRDLLKLQPRKMEFVIYRCSRIKARIIEQDEKEKKGIRTILNFGHTIGHAIEAASGFKKYTHGEAIALGMLAAASISTRLGLIPEELSLRIRKLIAAVGLPVKLNKVSLPKIIKAHYRDKKFIADINRFVLIKGLGRAIIRKGIALKIIQEALKELS